MICDSAGLRFKKINTEQIKEANTDKLAIHPDKVLGIMLANKPLIKKPIKGNNGIKIPGKVNILEEFNACFTLFNYHFNLFNTSVSVLLTFL